MTIGSYRIKADWGHVAGVTAGAAFILWYMLDTLRASLAIQNIGLIIPAGTIALVLWLVIVAGDIRITRISGAPERAGEDDKRAKFGENWRVPVFMGLLVLLLLGMIYVGFDLTAMVFIAVGLYILNERRWYVLIGYSVGFGLGAAYFFKSMLSYPIPMVFL